MLRKSLTAIFGTLPALALAIAVAATPHAAKAETVAPLNPPQKIKVAYVPIMKFAAMYVAKEAGGQRFAIVPADSQPVEQHAS